MASLETPGAPGVERWEPGTPVGRFTLLTPLAEGGMAELWLARQSGLKGFEKLVVIKRMMTSLDHDPAYVEMFLTEARLAAQLSHPNVVQIYELGDDRGSPYIVMEYLDGEDLSVVRRTGPKRGLPLVDHHSAKLVSMAAEGLHYAHIRTGLDGKPLGLVHRDISPQNLIATFDGGLKVVDFGIAKPASQHTNTGKLKGKLAYMSPEQARGESLDARSDVFSLGIVLFEVVTRSRLVPRLNDAELLSLMGGNDPFPRPSERRPDLPRALESIILKALMRKREQRFQTAREFHEALEAWQQESGKHVSAGDLADYLGTVFAGRIQERRHLIEAAMRSDLTPTSAKRVSNLASSSSTTSSRQSPTNSRTAPMRRGALITLAAFSIAALGIGGAVIKRMTDTATTTRANVPSEAVVPEPVVPQPVLMVDTVPPGAMLTVNGIERGRSPQILKLLGVGTHELQTTLEGYQPVSRTISLERPGQEVRIEIPLAKLPAPVIEAEAPALPKDVKPPTPAQPSLPQPSLAQPSLAQPTPKPAVRKVAVAGSGKLSLKTTPWSMVYLGPKKLGDTPLVNMQLPAGKHQLRLVNPETKGETSLEVEIKPNETTKLKF